MAFIVNYFIPVGLRAENTAEKGVLMNGDEFHVTN